MQLFCSVYCKLGVFLSLLVHEADVCMSKVTLLYVHMLLLQKMGILIIVL
jgi:hypothetical protein